MALDRRSFFGKFAVACGLPFLLKPDTETHGWTYKGTRHLCVGPATVTNTAMFTVGGAAKPVVSYQSTDYTVGVAGVRVPWTFNLQDGRKIELDDDFRLLSGDDMTPEQSKEVIQLLITTIVKR